MFSENVGQSNEYSVFFFIESRIWRVFLVAKNHRDFDSTKNHTILKVKFLSKNSN